MPVYKDDGNGTFYVQCYYRDARGSKRHKTKRGFSSEVEAAVWESQFKSLNGGAMDMTFSEFVEVYASEVKPRIREHTWITKEYIINDKLVPFFGDMRMCDVRPIDVIRWQNELTEHRDADGKPWAPCPARPSPWATPTRSASIWNAGRSCRKEAQRWKLGICTPRTG